MRCEEFVQMLDAFIDGELDGEQRARMLDHAENCDNCARELKHAEALSGLLAKLDAQPVVPLAAQAGWRGAVKAESRRRRLKPIYRAVGTVAAAFAVLVGGTFAMRQGGLLDRPVNGPGVDAGGAALVEKAAYSGPARETSIARAMGRASLETDGEATEEAILYEAAYIEDNSMPTEEAAPEARDIYAEVADADLADGDAVQGQYAMQMASAPAEPARDRTSGEDAGETLLARRAAREIHVTDFVSARAQVNDLVEEYGGYVASDSAVRATSSAEIVALVPQADLDAFLTALDYIGTVTSESLETEDITLDYFDARGRLETLEAEKNRLNELISSAEDADELEKLNEQFKDVYARIDELESGLREAENLLEYAQVRISLREGEPAAVGEDTGDRMRSGFSGTLQGMKAFFADMAVSLAVVAPVAAVVLPLAIVIWIVAAILVRRRRKRSEGIE